ncbi:MAG: S8 family serine peptidase [Chitinophagaceae bacterium]|nr:S8 family serine peptidase [Chitinophagaceae bacterium]
MKKYIIFIITIMYFSIYAQEMHYYFNNKKINLTKNLRTINVLTNSNYFLTLEDSLYEITTLYVDPEISKKYLKIYVKSNNPEYYNSLINILSNNNNIQNISYYFEREGTSPIGTSENFYLKVKDDNKSYQKLVDYSNIYGYTIVNPLPYMEKWYLIKLNPKNYDNVINVTSKLYETGDFDEIDPAFMFNFNSNCVNDPNFNQIWGLNNSNGNNIGICNAWNLSLGTNVKVAVVDQGIEKTHEDLSPNMSPLSFNTITGNSPSGNVNSHGTFIAGIIGGARNNGKGIAGVAPNCKIMSVKLPKVKFKSIVAQ